MSIEIENRLIITAPLPVRSQYEPKTVCQLYAHEPSRDVIVAGGGEYRGIQLGSAASGVPDLVLFNDPATHTTLALPILREVPVTAAAVRRKIERSRRRFQMQARAAVGHGNSHWGFASPECCT